MGDALSTQYADVLTGCYDCVDRIVLNAYNGLCHNAGGFRCWWRRLHGSDDTLDEAHLMRMAGRFSRRVRGFAGRGRSRWWTAAGMSASTSWPRSTWPSIPRPRGSSWS